MPRRAGPQAPRQPGSSRSPSPRPAPRSSAAQGRGGGGGGERGGGGKERVPGRHAAGQWPAWWATPCSPGAWASRPGAGGDVVASPITRPVEAFGLGLVAVGALAARRRPGVAAVVVAVAAAVLAAVATVAYSPVVAFVVRRSPSSPRPWRWRRRPGGPQRPAVAVAALAAVAAVLLAATTTLATTIYDRYYGPAHPSSSTPDVPVDRAEWAWSGGVTATAASVVARLRRGRRRRRAGRAGPPVGSGRHAARRARRGRRRPHRPVPPRRAGAGDHLHLRRGRGRPPRRRAGGRALPYPAGGPGVADRGLRVLRPHRLGRGGVRRHSGRGAGPVPGRR